MVRLQHRSAERHLDGVAAKLAEMVKKGAKKPGKGGRTVPLEGAEVRRLGKWYGDAMEVMLEHARMEERVLFPDIQRASFPGQFLTRPDPIPHPFEISSLSTDSILAQRCFPTLEFCTALIRGFCLCIGFLYINKGAFAIGQLGGWVGNFTVLRHFMFVLTASLF
jgi:hypothetical protein